MGQAPFIAVEGPIGVGKSSLAKAISDHFGYYFLQEIVDENPFLHKFYKDIGEWSFQTEMFFLCNRYKQLEDTERDYLSSGKPVAADYHIFKNLIFAKRSLHQDQYDKYVQVFDILTKGQAKPNLIIYLTAELDTLFARIKKRGRGFEKDIDPTYLKQLSADYEAYMDEYERRHPHIPVLRFDGDKLDFVANGNDLTFIFDAIQEKL
ncbi:deoxynucleoside kinase [Lederbergia citrea]|uniref:Deoxynucleoside kinase n=1 Tax=Lederbergia citrea TaxID=2833581 RepID=A0A942Z5T0_9BACI|nr:deoxynucleoside kinase [Lederbergia citrea]MBS4179769.1 deoxynucleoside kinase [Lederbergia citrea]MBS4206454.1 deoxynucleoside kinase [Lederbergia citrea]MBS4225074.1 deoxynucleoside kinase [Lederbergia citrea]